MKTKKGVIILISIFGIFAYSIINKKIEGSRRSEVIKNFPSYVATLQHTMDKSYEIIYRDKVLIFSLEGMKIDDAHFAAISRDFMALTLKFLGPTLSKEMEYLYGDKDTLYFNIIEYFNSKFEDDEIRKSARERMMDDEGPISGETV